MQPIEKIREFTRAVCDQIRWKKVHTFISSEIENHLADQRDAFIAQGMDESAATDNAILQMGDPVIVGTQLDRIHRPKPQWSMILLTMAILLIGLSARLLIVYHGYIWSMPWQFVYSAIGLIFMAIAYFSDFTLVGKYPKTTFFAIMALSAAAVKLSPIVNGRAFYAGFMPLLFPLAFAAIVYSMRNKGYRGIILCGLSYLLQVCVALFIPMVSGIILFTVSGLVIMSIAIYKRWFNGKRLNGFLLLFIPMIISVIGIVIGIYGTERLKVAIDPSLDPRGMGYVATATRALLDGSRLFGHGEMPSGYEMSAFPVPKASVDTDLMLTYIVFNAGWIVFAVITSVLLFFIVKGFLLCLRQKSGLGMFVSTAVMMTFTMQVIGYVIVNLGFQLIAPISLPLISYGNTATVINLGLIGLMLSVFRTGDAVKDTNPDRKLNTYRPA